MHHHVRRDRTGGFVHVVIERDVGVRVDNARRQIFSARIDHRGHAGAGDVLADGGNLSVLYINAAALDIAVSDGHHDGIFDQDFVMVGRRGLCGGQPNKAWKNHYCEKASQHRESPQNRKRDCSDRVKAWQ